MDGDSLWLMETLENKPERGQAWGTSGQALPSTDSWMIITNHQLSRFLQHPCFLSPDLGSLSQRKVIILHSTFTKQKEFLNSFKLLLCRLYKHDWYAKHQALNRSTGTNYLKELRLQDDPDTHSFSHLNMHPKHLFWARWCLNGDGVCSRHGRQIRVILS